MSSQDSEGDYGSRQSQSPLPSNPGSQDSDSQPPPPPSPTPGDAPAPGTQDPSRAPPLPPNRDPESGPKPQPLPAPKTSKPNTPSTRIPRPRPNTKLKPPTQDQARDLRRQPLPPLPRQRGRPDVSPEQAPGKEPDSNDEDMDPADSQKTLDEPIEHKRGTSIIDALEAHQGDDESRVVPGFGSMLVPWPGLELHTVWKAHCSEAESIKAWSKFEKIQLAAASGVIAFIEKNTTHKVDVDIPQRFRGSGELFQVLRVFQSVPSNPELDGDEYDYLNYCTVLCLFRDQDSTAKGKAYLFKLDPVHYDMDSQPWYVGNYEDLNESLMGNLRMISRQNDFCIVPGDSDSDVGRGIMWNINAVVDLGPADQKGGLGPMRYPCANGPYLERVDDVNDETVAEWPMFIGSRVSLPEYSEANTVIELPYGIIYHTEENQRIYYVTPYARHVTTTYELFHLKKRNPRSLTGGWIKLALVKRENEEASVSLALYGNYFQQEDRYRALHIRKFCLFSSPTLSPNIFFASQPAVSGTIAMTRLKFHKEERADGRSVRDTCSTAVLIRGDKPMTADSDDGKALLRMAGRVVTSSFLCTVYAEKGGPSGKSRLYCIGDRNKVNEAKTRKLDVEFYVHGDGARADSAYEILRDFQCKVATFLKAEKIDNSERRCCKWQFDVNKKAIMRSEQIAATDEPNQKPDIKNGFTWYEWVSEPTSNGFYQPIDKVHNELGNLGYKGIVWRKEPQRVESESDDDEEEEGERSVPEASPDDAEKSEQPGDEEKTDIEEEEEEETDPGKPAGPGKEPSSKNKLVRTKTEDEKAIKEELLRTMKTTPKKKRGLPAEPREVPGGDKRLHRSNTEEEKAMKNRLLKQREKRKAEQKRKADEEAKQKRREAEEAEQKRKADEEAKQRRREAEEAQRRKADEEAKQRRREAEQKRKAEEEAKQKRKAEEEAKQKRKAEEEAKQRRREAEQKRKADEEAKQRRREAEQKRKAEEEAKQRRREAEQKRKADEDADREMDPPDVQHHPDVGGDGPVVVGMRPTSMCYPLALQNALSFLVQGSAQLVINRGVTNKRFWSKHPLYPTALYNQTTLEVAIDDINHFKKFTVDDIKQELVGGTRKTHHLNGELTWMGSQGRKWAVKNQIERAAMVLKGSEKEKIDDLKAMANPDDEGSANALTEAITKAGVLGVEECRLIISSVDSFPLTESAETLVERDRYSLFNSAAVEVVGQLSKRANMRITFSEKTQKRHRVLDKGLVECIAPFTVTSMGRHPMSLFVCNPKSTLLRNAHNALGRRLQPAISCPDPSIMACDARQYAREWYERCKCQAIKFEEMYIMRVATLFWNTHFLPSYYIDPNPYFHTLACLAEIEYGVFQGSLSFTDYQIWAHCLCGVLCGFSAEALTRITMTDPMADPNDEAKVQPEQLFVSVRATSDFDEEFRPGIVAVPRSVFEMHGEGEQKVPSRGDRTSPQNKIWTAMVLASRVMVVAYAMPVMECIALMVTVTSEKYFPAAVGREINVALVNAVFDILSNPFSLTPLVKFIHSASHDGDDDTWMLCMLRLSDYNIGDGRGYACSTNSVDPDFAFDDQVQFDITTVQANDGTAYLRVDGLNLPKHPFNRDHFKRLFSALTLSIHEILAPIKQ